MLDRAVDDLVVSKSTCGRFQVAAIGLPGAQARCRSPEDLCTAAHLGDWPALQAFASFPGIVLLNDDVHDEVWVFGDQSGVRHLFYAETDHGLLFATQFSFLQQLSTIPRNIDPHCMIDVLQYEHALGNRTLLRAVRLLRPSEYIRAAGGNVSIAAKPETEGPIGGPVPAHARDDVPQELFVRLLAAVRMQTEGFRQVVVPLSGGLDSRALLGAAVACGRNVRAITFGNNDSLEVACAREVARAYDVPHEVVPIDGSMFPDWLRIGVEVSGGMVGACHFHIASLLDAIPADCIVLDGLGGDALSGGHLKPGMLLPGGRERAARLIAKLRLTGWRNPELVDLLAEPLQEALSQRPSLAERLVARAGAPTWEWCHEFDLRERQVRMISRGPEILRRKAVVASPFHAADVRAIFRALGLRQLVEQRAYLAMHRTYLPLGAAVADAGRRMPVAAPLVRRVVGKLRDAVTRRLRLRHGDRSFNPNSLNYPVWFAEDSLGTFRSLVMKNASNLGALVRPATIAMLDSQDALTVTSVGKLGVLFSLAKWNECSSMFD